LVQLSQPISCAGKHKIKVPLSEMPHDCHTQGIGWHAGTDGFVVTCMEEGGGDGARLAVFPSAANDGGQWLSTDSAKIFVSAAVRHPSATQLGLSVFPIAMAKSSADGPSVIHFYKIGPGPTVSGPLATLNHAASHVGAVAYANLEGQTQMIGCGWDCATISFWTASGTDRHEGFTLVKQAKTSELVSPGGVDSNVGAYNSINLVRRCEDDQPLLFASHEDWLDVWELSDLGTSSVKMKKIVKRQITEPVMLWGDRKLFYEGMALEIRSGEVRIWAAPHDFGTEECPAGTRCTQYIYRCGFGSS
jgi:hypothetical protein